MVKSSLHCKCFEACANLDKEQTTLMLMGIAHLNYLFFLHSMLQFILSIVSQRLYQLENVQSIFYYQLNHKK
jgi:hypothetical protein